MASNNNITQDPAPVVLARWMAAFKNMDKPAQSTMLNLAEKYAEQCPAYVPAKFGVVETSGEIRTCLQVAVPVINHRKAESILTTPSGEVLTLQYVTKSQSFVLSALNQCKREDAIRLIRGNSQPSLACVSILPCGKVKRAKTRQAAARKVGV